MYGSALALDVFRVFFDSYCTPKLLFMSMFLPLTYADEKLYEYISESWFAIFF